MHSFLMRHSYLAARGPAVGNPRATGTARGREPTRYGRGTHGEPGRRSRTITPVLARITRPARLRACAALGPIKLYFSDSVCAGAERERASVTSAHSLSVSQSQRVSKQLR